MSDRDDQWKLAFAKLPGLIRDAVRRFRRVTGYTAVTALCSSPMEAEPQRLVPPVHPRCAKLVPIVTKTLPCATEWRNHLEFGHTKLASLTHVCPLGLRCACVPVLVGGRLLGLAKCVLGPESSDEEFQGAVELLEILIARPGLELESWLLQAEVHSLHKLVQRLQRTRESPVLANNDSDRSLRVNSTQGPVEKQSGLMARVLDYLRQHFAERGLSLTRVAKAMGKNEKYLAHLFVQQVGERMRTHITALRVQRACDLLLETDLRVQEIAVRSGFTHVTQFRQAFRHAMGVSATEYRQIFRGGG